MINNPLRSVYTLVLHHYQHDMFENYLPKFTLKTMKVYMRQLLSTLDEIHQKGIIHRDLKP